MTYVQDEVADAAVSKSETLRDVVQGKALMLWRPGTLAAVGAQFCLMLAGIALLGSVLWLDAPTTARFKLVFLFGLIPLAVLTGGSFHGVVRGWPYARSATYRFALGLTALSGIALVVAVAQWRTISIACAASSLLLHLAAIRLIAGEGYAITSALFRAQRRQSRYMRGR